MIGSDQMVGPLGKFVSPFRPTTRKRGGDCTTTMRRRDVGAVVSGCLASTPVPLLLLESLTTPEITLNHQALVFYEQALRLLADNFSLHRLAASQVLPRRKKRPSWRSFYSSQENQAPRDILILRPPTRPWTSRLY